MIILVCGDREWKSYTTMWRRLKKFTGLDVTFMHGDCRGADKMSGQIAKDLGFQEAERFPADWTKHGKAAGPIRNRRMIEQNPDLVLAFHNDLSRSKGTADMVKLALKHGVPVEVLREETL